MKVTDSIDDIDKHTHKHTHTCVSYPITNVGGFFFLLC